MTTAEQFAYVTTIGRKTGLPRQIEIWFVELEGRYYIVAEHGLKAQWVQNILKNPTVDIRVGENHWKAVARVLDERKDHDLYIQVQGLERQKYGWGDGLPVEIELVRVS